MSTDGTLSSDKIEIPVDKADSNHAAVVALQLAKKRASKKKSKTEAIARGLANGGHWNPMQRYPRNQYCPCGSTVKFKKCCLPKIPLAVDKEHFDKYSAILEYGLLNPDWKWLPNDDLTAKTEESTDNQVHSSSESDIESGDKTQEQGLSSTEAT